MVENLIKKLHQKDVNETCKYRALLYIPQGHDKKGLRTDIHPHNQNGVAEGN